MKFSKLIYLPVLLICMAFSTGHLSAVVFLDFGVPQATASNTNPLLGDVYNNINGSNAPVANLLDSDGVETGWGFNFTANGFNAATGLTSSNIPGFANSATRDGFRSDGGVGQFTFTFTGLDDALTYDFYYFAHFNASPNRGANFALVTGTAPDGLPQGVPTTAQDPNTNPPVSFLITPDDGTISFTFTGTNEYGFTGGVDRAAVVNALRITAIPEPNSAALILGGLGVLVFLRRRRR